MTTRRQEVGQLRSTRQAAERSWETGSGGGGGKGAGQGKSEREKRAPDTEPGKCAKRSRSDTASSKEG